MSPVQSPPPQRDQNHSTYILGTSKANQYRSACIGFIYFASYTYFASTYFPWAPNAGNCMGEEYAAGFGVFIISSYLLLFISFYLTTYKTQAPRLYSQASRALGPKKEKGL